MQMLPPAILLLAFLSLSACQRADREVQERLIHEHRFSSGMTEEQVRRSLGEPVQADTLENGHLQWTYAKWIIEFDGGKVIGSKVVAASAMPIDRPAEQAPRADPFARSAGVSGSRNPLDVPPVRSGAKWQ